MEGESGPRPRRPAPAARWDVLGLGCVAVDDLLYVESFPAPDAKTLVARRERQCGGLTATALVAAARLGSACAFAGLLGTDDLSRYAGEAMSREGVDLSLAVTHPDARPIHSTIIVDVTSHTRSILFHLGGRVGADDRLPRESDLRAARVLFLDHYSGEGGLRAARIARSAGIPVVADIERLHTRVVERLMEQADHLIVSQDFALSATGAANPGLATRELARRTGGTVVTTLGAEGCLCCPQGGPSLLRVPAFAVEVVDTTGCGDVFHGAYASALARGLAVEERLRFASAAAALKATRRGGQLGVPSRAEVEAFLADRE